MLNGAFTALHTDSSYWIMHQSAQVALRTVFLSYKKVQYH